MQTHGLATISAMYVPAFLSTCAVLKEAGCYTLNGDNIDKMMVDLPDGLFEIYHTSNCCNDDLDIGAYTDNILKSNHPSQIHCR